MALPEGITTATVTAGVPVTHSGAPVKSFVSIEPSAYLVHAATGTPLVDFLEEISVSEGVAAQFTLPHTDQAGFVDENGNAYTNWYYTARITYSTASKAKSKAPKVKVFQLATGQTEVDLDTLPGGAPALPYSAPVATVTSFGGRTGAVTVQETDLPERLTDTALSATYASELSTPGKAARTVLDKRVDTEFHDSFAGKPNGVPTVGDTGQAYTIYPQTGNRVPTIRNGKLSFATDNPGATTFGSGGYANIKTERPITHADASFTLTPWDTVGGLACLALMTDVMLGTVHKSPAHLIVAPEYWSFGVFTADGTSLVVLKQVNYKTNLVTDGTKVHTMSVDIDYNSGTAYVSVPYPDGTQQVFAIQHDAIKTPAYAAYIEPYQGTDTTKDYSLAEFTEWNLGTGTSRQALVSNQIRSRQGQMTTTVVQLAANQTLTTSFAPITGVTIAGRFGKTGKCRFDVQVPIQHRGPADVYFVLNDGANGNVGSTNTRVLKGRPTIIDANDVEDRNVCFKMDAAGEAGKEFSYILQGVAFGVNAVESPPGAKALVRGGANSGYNVIIDAFPY